MLEDMDIVFGDQSVAPTPSGRSEREGLLGGAGGGRMSPVSGLDINIPSPTGSGRGSPRPGEEGMGGLLRGMFKGSGKGEGAGGYQRVGDDREV